MKGEIVGIHKEWNGVEFKWEYHIGIKVNDKPSLKLGNCEVNQ
jgi:hypothetical protein